jgi:hypothetical protein
VDFSNAITSQKTSAGLFVTGEIYVGQHGRSLRLHGLQPGVNDNAFQRRIVIHGAPYVSWKTMLVNGGRLGHSSGCPAVAEDQVEHIIGQLQRGSLVYIHTPS